MRIKIKLQAIIKEKMEKLKVCVLNATKDELIQVISSRSSRYGDKLIDFMDRYSLYCLQDATVQQLREYVSDNLCPCRKNIDKGKML